MKSFINKNNKTFPLFILLTIASFLTFQSCGNSDSNANKATGNIEKNATQNLQEAQSQGSQGSQVFHYKCPNGHNHGADNMGGTCPECGGEYVHNDAYHANDNSNAQPQQPNIQMQQLDIQPQQPNISAPQIQMGGSKSGVFHYICPSGHAGGSENLGGKCAVCGASLVHNDAYHN